MDCCNTKTTMRRINGLNADGLVNSFNVDTWNKKYYFQYLEKYLNDYLRTFFSDWSFLICEFSKALISLSMSCFGPLNHKIA